MITPTDLHQGAQGAEYRTLADALVQNIGASAAQPMLDALAQLYADPAERLLQLRKALGEEAVKMAIEQAKAAETRATQQPTATTEFAARDQRTAPRQVTKRERQRRAKTGPVNAPATYTMTGGFFRMPNDVADDLIAAMPGPVLKAYVYAHRLARIDGTFWISYDTIAKKIGCKDPRYGLRLFSRLQEAGLLRLVERGGAKARKANTYQLVPLDVLDLERVRQTLAQPLNLHDKREGSHRKEVLVGATA
jgi:hypothetical protein